MASHCKGKAVYPLLREDSVSLKLFPGIIRKN
jgi:hypothetical protein